MNSKTTIQFHGDKELVRDMKTLVDTNYNEGYNALRRAGTAFKKQLRSRVRSSVRSDTNLTRGFWTSAPHGIKFRDMQVDFAGEGNVNHHWHLIEEGHRLVRPNLNRYRKRYTDAGAVLGYVEGIHSVDKIYEDGVMHDVVEKEMVKALDKGLKKGNLA